MHRILISVLVLIALSFVCGAYAAHEMVNPYFQEANNMPLVPMTFSMRSANRITVDISFVQEASLARDTVFSASASGGAGNYEYCFYLLDPSDTSDEYPTGNPHGYRSPSSVSTFSYRLVVPGTYTALVYVRDNLDENWDAVDTLTFTVRDENAPTTEKIISTLAAECVAAGCDTDFEKALWFHDWLTKHAYYDLTYTYYSADGVLLRGTGVCDSYSKAYEKLLKAVGVQSVRVTNVDHAWNLVKLDGEWYHIDPTWDDPVVSGKETAADSGAEYHMYFGLPDRIMKLDRTFSKYSGTIQANGIERNYYLMTRRADAWIEPLSNQLSDKLASQGYAVRLSLPGYYTLENGQYASGKESVVYNVAAYAMSNTDWIYGVQTLPMDFSYNADSKAFSGEIRFSDERKLSLPTALQSIGEEAFTGYGLYLEIDIPDGAVEIGNRAFSDNPALWKISIPDSVIAIANDAFEGSENVTIVCKAGSYAEAFAKRTGIKYQRK